MPTFLHCDRHSSVICPAIAAARARASSSEMSKKGAASIAALIDASWPLSGLMPVSRCRWRSGCGLISNAGESTQAPSSA